MATSASIGASVNFVGDAGDFVVVVVLDDLAVEAGWVLLQHTATMAIELIRNTVL
jgi:hypothetical protein